MNSRASDVLNGKSIASSRNLLTPPTKDDSYDGDSLLPPRRYKSINITELEVENTIHLQATPQRMTFEPKEIAARSTMDQCAPDQVRRKLEVDQLAPDIQELLHQSFADEIRELGSKYKEKPDLNLPRTADMSRMSSVRGSLSSIPSKEQEANSAKQNFWDISSAGLADSWMQKELSQLDEIDFRPAEEQTSRLLKDEMAWEQENAIIPQVYEQQPKSPLEEKVKKLKNLKNHVDFSCFSGYLEQEDVGSMQATHIDDSSYCSVGEYFNKMSSSLKGMIPDGSPPRRTPYPLVDVSNLGLAAETVSKSPLKSKIDHKKVSPGSDKENSLSVSSIMKALNSIPLEDSPTAFIDKLTNLRKAKSNLAATQSEVAAAGINTPASDHRQTKQLHKTTSLKTDLNCVTKSPSFVRDLDEVKKRVPRTSGALSDTASFTESLLESSAFVPMKPVPVLQTPAPSSAAKSDRSEYDAKSQYSTGRKPFLDTYRVSTATKLSEHQLELPPVPIVRDPPKCQRQIITNDAPVKPNRKRRSSSATRQELQENEDKLQEAALIASGQKRSRSPCNLAELKAVASHLVEYPDTPKGTVPSQRGVVGPGQKSFLSPEPRSRETQMYGGTSAFTSPKSVASNQESETEDRAALTDPSRAQVSGNFLFSSARSASQCSVAGSEFSHKDGILPLKATHTEISWGSSRLRRNEKKSMQIKNISPKKLVIKASITGPGFQLCGMEQSGILTLQSQECRTITVDFCPTVIGAAVGLLSFQPPHDCYSQRIVSLFGYGGEASLRVEGIQKGPSGPYLELGQARNLGCPLEKSFSLYNKGSLPAFARIGIDKKGLDQTFLASAVYVQPQRVIIPPNSYAHIHVIFKPRRQEVAKILQKQVDVLSITNLHILWGDEPTRHRIRKIITLIKRNDLQQDKIAPLESVCEVFPKEKEFNELESFTENLFETIHELFLTLREYELVLTVDRALDETMIDLTLSEDSSDLFKTMFISSDVGSPRLPEDISPGFAPALQSAKRESGESWSVRPTFLEFRPTERTKQFVIKSNFYSTQFFELNSNFRPLFRFSPMEGQIRPGQEVVVNVDFQSGPPTQQQILIVVYIENQKITIPVYVRNRI
ncbi:uncharacterized protein LOC131691938 [Topomyia yanbarensis]|uniref:uncharacterized protein LOC131691938 n=1 Tax=Topomyia yanbarensis TaxID=2498891 RepID=UPI00273C0E45|nr:uncharacterized protein LOC131691938 [Topomyia yanbarensis]XP_058834690.1 uncharacterized protein LOC131691938 [Topomyia yanbarensis]